MTHPSFDPTVKTLVEVGPVDWTVFAGQPAAPTRVIDAAVAAVGGAADKVLHVGAEPPYLLHLEFVSGHDAAALPVTLNKRNVLLDDRHGLLVRTVVILLQPSADSPALTGLWQRGFPDESPYNVFGYRVIRAWQIPPAQLLAGGLGTLPLAPISAATEAELPGIIEAMQRRLRRRDARRREEELWSATNILLGLRYPRATVQELLRGVRSMRESSTYQAILEEGRQEGRVEGARAILLQLGTDLLGPPTPRARRAVARITDRDRLEALIRRVPTAGSWHALLSDAPSR
jgi:hypothetical protein